MATDRRSCHWFLPLPDFVEVFPTHVAGSLCGGNIGSRLSTTIGYERRMNQLLTNLSSVDTLWRDAQRRRQDATSAQSC